MPNLRLYNSLTRQKEEFKPLDPAHVRLYACGPTVYNYAHIGNARMAVVFDLLARVLKTQHPKVTYVSNITDVDDKIIDAAKETGEAINSITEKYTKIYNEDMAALGVARPDLQPKATEHIGDMIALIETLIAKKHAYAADGHVLFSVPSFPAYGGLSGRSREEQIAGARVEVAPYKKDPADFVLWKPSTGDQPGWDSPWGFGRPGWHIECSAMAGKILGLPFDIHGGGADLKFPHHENEIAQSCCAEGNPEDLSSFAKYWVHNGFVTVEGEKMSKSIGNIRLVHNLVEHYDGEVLRFALLSGHYRQPLDWSEATIEQARKSLSTLYTMLRTMKDVQPAKNVSVPGSVLGALNDDLNTPKAISALMQMRNDFFHSQNANDGSVIKAQLLESGRLMGLLQEDPEIWLGYGQSDDAEQIEALLQERQDAKKNKNFKRADEIRDQLAADGIAIEDTPQGTKWKKI